MNKLMQTALDLTIMEIENTLHSKVEGRRNWVIRVETRTTISGKHKRVIVYRGGYGNACDHGIMRCFLNEIGEKQIRWYEFTYKKDYLFAVKQLKDTGAYDLYGELAGLN